MMEESPAWDCLLRLLAAAWDPKDIEQPESIPWSGVVNEAMSHGVGPHLRASLQKSGLRIPREIQAGLDHEYFRTAKDKVLRFRELEQVLIAFAEAGVPVLLLKGAALIGTIYGNSAVRPMLDLDLLVPPHHADACKAILTHRGYRPVEGETALGYHDRSELAFISNQPSRTVIDLHWHLFDIPYYMHRIPLDWIWENTEAYDIAGQPVQVLNPEANILYLSAHLAFHHRFRGLLWFVDLATLVHQNRDGLDWDEIIASAAAFRLILPLREALDRLASYWPSLPLAEPRRRLSSLRPTVLERAIFRLRTAEPGTPLLNNIAYIVCLPHWSARVRFILLNTFPPPDYMIERYGAKGTWQLPLWHLYRLGDGIGKAIRAWPQVVRLGRGSEN